MTRLAYVPNRIIDHNGIADGATVHVYLSGSTTPILLYSDSALTVPLANPFSVASGAAFPDVFYDSSVNIKLTIVSALDGSIEEHDPYNPLSVSVTSPIVSVKAFGATGDGVTNDGAAFVAAIAALKAYALNPGPGSIYVGSPKLFVPAGHYYLGTTTLDINHTLVIEGEGSGWFGPGAAGCSHLRWANGVSGIRFQAYRTSGNTTVDGADHSASGGGELSRLCLEGGFAGTESESHALVIRNAIRATDLYLKNWSGDGVKGWTGNVNGAAYGGNISTTRLIGVKTENCRIGFDFRGTDSNLIIFEGCEGYQNRQAGFVDENAAGGNHYIACHATFNGLIGGSYPSNRATYSGNRYAVKWGQEAWCSTNAPSGTTVDNTGWLYVSAGGADAAHIAWTTGLTWRGGGDYVTLTNCWNALLSACYSESGGFSQFNDRTLVIGGTNIYLASRGGKRLLPSYDGLSLYDDNSPVLNLKNPIQGGVNFANYSDATYGYVVAVAGEGMYMFAPVTNGFVFRNGTTGGTATEIGRLDATGYQVPTGSAYYVNAQKVVGARGSAIARLTRTATSGSLPTADGSITIANGATPTVQELLEYCTELEAKLEALTASLRAATGHGLIA